MLMMAALLQLIPRCLSASAASFSRGRKACRGRDLRHQSPSSPSQFPVFGAGVALRAHLARLQGPDGVGGVDEAHVLRCLGGQGAAACGARVVDQEVEASTSHLLPHLPDCCLDAVGVCHICTGTGGFGDGLVAATLTKMLQDVAGGHSQPLSILLVPSVTWLS